MPDADRIPEMQNVLGAFFHRCADMSADGIGTLFASNAWVELPEAGVSCRGGGEVEQVFANYFEKERKEGARCWHIPHNLSIKLPLEENAGQLYCETHSFRAMGDGMSFVMFCTRADVDLTPENGSWKISKLRWYTAQVFQPIRGSAGDLKAYSCPAAELRPGRCGAGDHIAIQNLLGRFALWNRRGAADLFADDPGCRLTVPGLLDGPSRGKAAVDRALKRLEEMERENLGYYLAVPYLGAPVVHVDGDQAEGWWLSHTYRIRSAAFGMAGRENTVRQMERFHCTFVRRSGVWKILTMDVERMAEFPPEPFDKEIHGQTPLWEAGDHWPYPECDGENYAADYPEDMYAVQSLFAQWGLRLRRREMRRYPELYFIKDKSEIVVDIHRRCNKGLENIWDRLEEFDTNCRPKQTTSHNTSSPYFIMDQSGDRAKVYWLDQSWTNMNAVFGIEADPVKFMLNCGMYCFEYHKEDGVWKTAKIWWRVIYRLPDLEMDHRPPCFCNSDADVIWPLPFDTVYY